MNKFFLNVAATVCAAAVVANVAYAVRVEGRLASLETQIQTLLAGKHLSSK